MKIIEKNNRVECECGCIYEYEKDDIKVLQEPKRCKGGCDNLRDEGLDEATLRELKKLED